MYPKRELMVVPECNDENDDPTCWAIEGGDKEKKHFVWVTKYDEKEYVVEDSEGHNLAEKTYKTLWGAKRAAEGIIWRQEETGYYTN